MFILETFNDSSWKYSFIVLMCFILIGCGIYSYFKMKKNNKSNEKEIHINNPDDEYTRAVLDNEDIILKKKDNQ